jgi:hypothetical protein
VLTPQVFNTAKLTRNQEVRLVGGEGQTSRATLRTHHPVLLLEVIVEYVYTPSLAEFRSWD